MKTLPRIFVLSLLLFLLAACGRGRDINNTPNVEATVAAAVQATAVAQTQMQVSVDAAVQATTVAQNASAALTPTPTPVVITTTETVTEIVTEIVYVPQDVYVTMSEDELEALIDEAVAQAVAATEASAEAAAAATSDAVVTSQEVESVEVYVHLAEETIAYAEEVLATYGQLYTDSSAEMVAALNGIQQELATLNDSAASIATSLAEISTSLEAGLALAEESIAQLESAAIAAQATADQVQAQAVVWQAAVQAQVAQAQTAQAAFQNQAADFAALIQDIQPQQMAADLPASLQMVRSFAEVAQHSLADGQIDQNEILAIAQAGANASAGLQRFGGPQMQGMSGSIDTITSALARNDLPAAQQGLDGLNRQMPAIGAGNGMTDRPGAVQSPTGGRRP
ncbi:MAG: hypothetical protein WBO46_19610 [Caldilineaceae bacterium]